MSWPLLTAETASAVMSAASVIIALSAAVTTFWFARQNLRREVQNQQLNLMAAELKYFEDFWKWANQVADALTEAAHLCDLDPKGVVGEPFFDRRHRLRITLSTMVDRGRWFFPNIEVDQHGADNELGFRG